MTDLETDPKVVARLAESKEDENWRFRTFLKGVGSDELDAIVDRHYKDVASRIDCCTCGNCCKLALPILGRKDVNRLADGLALSKDAVIDRFLESEEEPETYTFNAKPCPLLKDKRCTVYDSRPDDCRSYPHLHKEGFSGRLIGVIGNCSICPIVYNVLERLKNELWDGSDFDFDDY
jgi:Fe-S-cluster containining protein